ncbi:MAG: SRPBCC family protein [Dehalococcoidia bacterium]
MTTASYPTAEIVADPYLPVIHITRDFAASRDKVFRAHADPELFAQWMGPRESTFRMVHWDFRTGGSYRWEDSGEGYVETFYGSFHQVVPGEMIVQTFGFESMPEAVALERLVLEDLGEGRCRLRTSSLVDSFEAREGMMASGMDIGVNEGYEKLDELLAR